MVPELRQRHRLVWLVWAALLPLGFVFAVLVLPKEAYQPRLVDHTPQALPLVEQSRESEWLAANLRAQPGHSGKQLEIILKQPVAEPSASLFWQNTFIGNLGAKGVHRFALDSVLVANPPFHLKIENPINQTLVYQTTFEQ